MKIHYMKYIWETETNVIPGDLQKQILFRAEYNRQALVVVALQVNFTKHYFDIHVFSFMDKHTSDSITTFDSCY